MKVPAGPDCGSKQSTGLVQVALKALAHCPRPEGSFPEEMTTLFDEEPRSRREVRAAVALAGRIEYKNFFGQEYV